MIWLQFLAVPAMLAGIALGRSPTPFNPLTTEVPTSISSSSPSTTSDSSLLTNHDSSSAVISTSLLSGFSSTTSSTPSAISTAPASGSSEAPGISVPPFAAVAASSSTSLKHRTLIIVLSTTLPALAVVVILAVFLCACYRRGRLPFSRRARRGATPIDDDEIATWRGNTQPMAQTPRHHHKNSSVVFSLSESTSPVHGSPLSARLGEESIASPPIARAPNARSGLTDEAIPGAEPFIPQLKRQSSKLSKRLPSEHRRSKSGRSSSSFSMKERPASVPFFDVDPETVQRHMRGDSKGSRKNSFARTSISDNRAEATSGTLHTFPLPPAAPQHIYSPNIKEMML